jgi:hypothetical protein
MASTKKNKPLRVVVCRPLDDHQIKEAIMRKAEEIFVKSGRLPGHDLDNWLEAERVVKSEMCSDLTHMPC